MATKKQRRAPADGAATAANLQAAWPFPTKTKPFKDFGAALEAAPMESPPTERIHVNEVQLYTDPTKNTVDMIAIEQLVESPFNPRTRFAGLEELAETMKAVGVMQPILARPVTLPGGFEIRKGDEPQQAYEIIYGHRRTRAAKIAGLAQIPCIVRALTDAQAAQLQAIENVQRKDLDPVEEARGYKQYLDAHGVTKDQLAADIGLSRTHVYSRLKLATAIPAVLVALQTGEIYEENALRIARLPNEKLQQKALDAIRKDYRYDPDDGGKKSVRRIQEFLREKFTLQLSGAIFDVTDAQLLEGCGACTDCPKRSGNAPEFADLANDTSKRAYERTPTAGPNLCTDPDCFEAKKKAHLAAKAAILVTKGKTVITGGKARSAISAEGQVKNGFVALKDVKDALATAKKAGKEIATVVIQNPRDGKTVEAVEEAALVAAGVKKKAKSSSSSGTPGWSEKEREEHARQQKEREQRGVTNTRINRAILAAVRQAAAGKAPSAIALQRITAAAYAGMSWGEKQLLAELHRCKSPDALEKQIGSMPPDRLATLLLDCALVENVVDDGWDRNPKPTALLAVAKELDVDVAEIRKDVSAKAADTKTEDLLQGIEQDQEEAEEA